MAASDYKPRVFLFLYLVTAWALAMAGVQVYLAFAQRLWHLLAIAAFQLLCAALSVAGLLLMYAARADARRRDEDQRRMEEAFRRASQGLGEVKDTVREDY